MNGAMEPHHFQILYWIMLISFVLVAVVRSDSPPPEREYVSCRCEFPNEGFYPLSHPGLPSNTNLFLRSNNRDDNRNERNVVENLITVDGILILPHTHPACRSVVFICPSQRIRYPLWTHQCTQIETHASENFMSAQISYDSSSNVFQRPSKDRRLRAAKRRQDKTNMTKNDAKQSEQYDENHVSTTRRRSKRQKSSPATQEESKSSRLRPKVGIRTVVMPADSPLCQSFSTESRPEIVYPPGLEHETNSKPVSPGPFTDKIPGYHTHVPSSTPSIPMLSLGTGLPTISTSPSVESSTILPTLLSLEETPENSITRAPNENHKESVNPSLISSEAPSPLTQTSQPSSRQISEFPYTRYPAASRLASVFPSTAPFTSSQPVAFSNTEEPSGSEEDLRTPSHSSEPAVHSIPSLYPSQSEHIDFATSTHPDSPSLRTVAPSGNAESNDPLKNPTTEPFLEILVSSQPTPGTEGWLKPSIASPLPTGSRTPNIYTSGSPEFHTIPSPYPSSSDYISHAPLNTQPDIPTQKPVESSYQTKSNEPLSRPSTEPSHGIQAIEPSKYTPESSGPSLESSAPIAESNHPVLSSSSIRPTTLILTPSSSPSLSKLPSVDAFLSSHPSEARVQGFPTTTSETSVPTKYAQPSPTPANQDIMKMSEKPSNWASLSPTGISRQSSLVPSKSSSEGQPSPSDVTNHSDEVAEHERNENPTEQPIMTRLSSEPSSEIFSSQPSHHLPSTSITDDEDSIEGAPTTTIASHPSVIPSIPISVEDMALFPSNNPNEFSTPNSLSTRPPSSSPRTETFSTALPSTNPTLFPVRGSPSVVPSVSPSWPPSSSVSRLPSTKKVSTKVMTPKAVSKRGD